jgi:hypothetical protein
MVRLKLYTKNRKIHLDTPVQPTMSFSMCRIIRKSMLTREIYFICSSMVTRELKFIVRFVYKRFFLYFDGIRKIYV